MLTPKSIVTHGKDSHPVNKPCSYCKKIEKKFKKKLAEKSCLFCGKKTTDYKVKRDKRYKDWTAAICKKCQR